MAEEQTNDYGLSKVQSLAQMAAPELPYQPPVPKNYSPGIGLIGCGGIAVQHLNAYRHNRYRVVALCDRIAAKAREYQAEFYPDAQVTTDYRELLARADIEVVDIATHPADRVPLIEAALRAGKHVLSQKPFVTDLDVGERLVDLADKCQVQMAVNQNGRWAPHFSYMRQAINAGLIGDLTSVSFMLHWDHSWVVGTAFENIRHLILYDFAIHWFDLLAQFFQGRTAKQVFARVDRASNQQARPPMLAQVMVAYEDALASMFFNAAVTHGQEDRTIIAGTKGTLVSAGPSLSEQVVTVYTADGFAVPRLAGTWFHEGFHGAMGELLCAIEEGRAPLHNARANLQSLALCFAALASAEDGLPKVPGQIRSLPVK